jgi:hypothetical protein
VIKPRGRYKKENSMRKTRELQQLAGLKAICQFQRRIPRDLKTQPLFLMEKKFKQKMRGRIDEKIC